MKWLLVLAFVLTGCDNRKAHLDTTANSAQLPQGPNLNGLTGSHDLWVCINTNQTAPVSTVVLKMFMSVQGLTPVASYEADVTVNGVTEKWQDGNENDDTQYQLGNRSATITLDPAGSDGQITIKEAGQPDITVVCSDDHTDYAEDESENETALVNDQWCDQIAQTGLTDVYAFNVGGNVLKKHFRYSNNIQGNELISQETGTWSFDGRLISMNFPIGLETDTASFNNDFDTGQVASVDIHEADGLTTQWTICTPTTSY